MPERISQPALDKFLRTESRKFGREELERRVENKKPFTQGRRPDKSIFLCHSHLDKTIVLKVGLLFDKVDLEIYVDWMDSSLPPITDKQTAATIKNKIERCKKFLFVATVNSLQSRWCNWELGLAYSLKKESEIAILPIESKTKRWRGYEYLRLFPEMKIETEDLENIHQDQIKIKGTQNSCQSFQQWIQ
ncbi:toll/interleukin-1 receptor domain-containing protein [Flavisolibacter sp. BT320]|nr:toll/interleukin-1 receptor domain-containing protein [Flavisolibacter longurius]